MKRISSSQFTQDGYNPLLFSYNSTIDIPKDATHITIEDLKADNIHNRVDHIDVTLLLDGAECDTFSFLVKGGSIIQSQSFRCPLECKGEVGMTVKMCNLISKDLQVIREWSFSYGFTVGKSRRLSKSRSSSSSSSLVSNIKDLVDYLSPLSLPIGILLSMKNYHIAATGVIMIGTVASSMKLVRQSRERGY